MASKRYVLDDLDVFNIPGGIQNLFPNPTSLASDLRLFFSAKVGAWANSLKAAALFSSDGCECEVLQLGSPTWKKGRLRFVVEFEPDMPEEVQVVEGAIDVRLLTSGPVDSPLDEIRQMGQSAS